MSPTAVVEPPRAAAPSPAPRIRTAPVASALTSGAPVKRYPVLAYYLLAFAISWGGILLVLAAGGSAIPATQEQFDRLVPFAIVTLLAGPPVASLLLTGLVDGRPGYRGLLAHLCRWRVGVGWYAVALLTAPAAFAAASLAMSLASPAYLPAILTRSDTGTVLLLATAPSLLVGFGEELGWTGFAVPRLLRRHGVLATGLFTGVLWGAWHLLTNDVWAGNVIAAGLPVPLMVAVNGLSLVFGELLVYRVLMVWLYDRTGSLLLAMLMHAAFAFGTFALQPDGVSGLPMLLHGLCVSAVLWAMVAVVAVAQGKHLALQPLGTRAA